MVAALTLRFFTFAMLCDARLLVSLAIPINSRDGREGQDGEDGLAGDDRFELSHSFRRILKIGHVRRCGLP